MVNIWIYVFRHDIDTKFKPDFMHFFSSYLILHKYLRVLNWGAAMLNESKTLEKPILSELYEQNAEASGKHSS